MPFARKPTRKFGRRGGHKARDYRKLGGTPAPAPAPSPWPYSYAEANDVVGIGSSTMSAPHSSAPLSWMQQDSTGGTYYAPGASIPGSGGVLVANRGVGGTTSATIESSFIAEGARVKASDLIASVGGNYETSQGPVPGIVTNCADIAAAAGHNRILFAPKHSDGAAIASSGNIDWHRLRDLNRRLSTAYPGRVTDSAMFFRYGYTARDATDTATMTQDRVANSLWGSNASVGTDTAHLNGDDATIGYTSGNHLLSRHVYAPWRDARNGGPPFIPHQTITSLESTNQTNNGLVGTIQHDVAWHPTLAGVTVEIVGNANFSASIESDSIKLRRATGVFLSDGFYVLTVRVTAGGKRRDSFVRVFLCDAAPVGNYRTSLLSQWMVRERLSTDAVQDSQTLSIAIGLKPVPGSGWDYVAVSNTVAHTLIRTGAGGSVGGIDLTTKQSTNQNLGFVVRNSANTTVVNIDSPTGQGFREANGLRWYFASIDLANNIGKVAVDANASVTGTIVNGGTMRLSPAINDTLEYFFATQIGGSPCPMELAALWMSTSYVDFGPTTGNRDLVRNAATGKSVLGTTRGADAPGVVNGVAPWRWFEGHAGNIAAGLNLANTAERWDCSDRAMMTSVTA